MKTIKIIRDAIMLSLILILTVLMYNIFLDNIYLPDKSLVKLAILTVVFLLVQTGFIIMFIKTCKDLIFGIYNLSRTNTVSTDLLNNVQNNNTINTKVLEQILINNSANEEVIKFTKELIKCCNDILIYNDKLINANNNLNSKSAKTKSPKTKSPKTT